MDKPAPRAYRFGKFRVDLQRRQLTEAEGANLNLSARAYDVLTYLVQYRDRVVGKDELMKAVWPRSVVEENNLNQAVTLLRRALGDRRDAPQYVRTIAGRGYRFVGEVTEEAAGQEPEGVPEQPQPLPLVVAAPAELRPASQAGRRRLLLGLGLATLAAGATGAFLWRKRSAPSDPPFRSLAVLPFRPLVDGAGDAALELGMADALITRLSGLPGLVVRPLSSVRSFDAAQQDALTAGRDLGTEAVLEGYVVVRDNRVRMTARLLEVSSGAALWSGSFEEPFDNRFFEAQDALASQVVSALEIELTPRDRQQLLERPTNDIHAWQLYVNGRYYWERKTPEGFRRAVEYFEAAEKLDPAFALAAVGQADSWAVLGVYAVMTPTEAFGRAGAAAERALRLSPELPEALATMGHVLVQGRRKWRDGERLYRRALEARPDFAQCRMWLANVSAFQGRLGEALPEARRAQELEPASLTFAANVGLILYVMRDYAAAIAHLEPIVEVAPEFPLARQHLARVLVASGAPGKAISLLEGHSLPAPGSLSNLGSAYAAAGRRELALAQVEDLESMGARGFGVGFEQAVIFALLGESDRALDAIERGIRDGSQGMTFLNIEPRLDSIRNQPRFRAASRQIGLG